MHAAAEGRAGGSRQRAEGARGRRTRRQSSSFTHPVKERAAAAQTAGPPLAPRTRCLLPTAQGPRCYCRCTQTRTRSPGCPDTPVPNTQPLARTPHPVHSEFPQCGLPQPERFWAPLMPPIQRSIRRDCPGRRVCTSMVGQRMEAGHVPPACTPHSAACATSSRATRLAHALTLASWKF